MPSGYTLRVKRDAERDLERLPQADRRRTINRIRRLAVEPRPVGCKKLGEPDIYRIRQGDYRIIYQIDDALRVVQILKIGHRREVYR